MNKLQEATKEFLKSDIPEFDSGDTVAVDVKVREGNKERVQRYEGVVVSRQKKPGCFIYSSKGYEWCWRGTYFSSALTYDCIYRCKTPW